MNQHRIFKIFEIFWLARIRMMVREMPINVTVKLGDVRAQLTEEFGRQWAADTVTGINNNLHFASDLNVIGNAFNILIFYCVFPSTGVALTVVFVANSLGQFLYFLL